MALPPKLSEPKRPAKKVSPDSPSDYTGGGGQPNRVLHINLWLIKYGTDDKFQGAAVMMSLLLIILLITALVMGACSKEFAPTCDKIVAWVQPVLTLVIGAAIGKSLGK